MVVITLLSIVSALALPSFTQTIARYRLLRASEDLIATLYLARSEAIRRGSPHILIERSTPSDCAAASITGRWDCGWNIYLTSAAQGKSKSAAESAADGENKGDSVNRELLHTTARFKRVEISHNNKQAQIALNRWGDLGIHGFGLKALTSKGELLRAICVEGAGRIRTVNGSATCQ